LVHNLVQGFDGAGALAGYPGIAFPLQVKLALRVGRRKDGNRRHGSGINLYQTALKEKTGRAFEQPGKEVNHSGGEEQVEQSSFFHFQLFGPVTKIAQTGSYTLTFAVNPQIFLHMKKIATALFCILLAAACQTAPAGEAADLTGYTLESVPGSSWKKAIKTDGDRVVEEGYIAGGKKTGVWVTYYNDTKNYPRIIASYADGVLEGPYMEVNNYGQYEMVAHYSQSKLHGRVAKYNLTRLVEEMYYQDGLLEGPYTLYFPNSEVKQRTAEFKKGKEDGIIRFYNDQGKITMEYEYRNGEKISGGIVEEGAAE
jgi:hypothetical protein